MSKNSIEILTDTAKCYGCYACVNVCPVNAIDIRTDKYFNKYPKIDGNKCLECGLCKKVCISDNKRNEESDNNVEYYIAKYKDENIRNHSRSGGFFVALSNYVLEKDGIVYGAKLVDDEVIIGRAVTKEERDSFCGSKYVESLVKNQYKNVITDLKNNKLVLYSGTPCQIYGLLSLLKLKNINTQNLITCDLICHGAPIENIFKDYMLYLKNKYNCKIDNFNFRDKSYGWDSHIESFNIGNKKIISKDYTSLFYSHSFFKSSCYECSFASLYRYSDITIADAWGVKRHNPQFNDNKGVSLAFLNSKKAKYIFHDIKEYLFYEKVDIENYLQPNMQEASKKNKNTKKIIELYNTKDIGKVIKKCNDIQKKIVMKNYVKKKIATVFHLLRKDCK